MSTKVGLASLAAAFWALCCAGAIGHEPPAYGQVDATVGCDFVAGVGLVVTVLDEQSRARARDNFGIDVELGDACLPALAKFPPAFVRLASVLDDSAEGTTVPDCLIWILDAGNVTEASLPGIGSLFLSPRRSAVCEVGEGVLNTVFVSGTDYLVQPGESCGVSLGVLSLGGARSSGPVAVKLLNDGTQTFGGLLFTAVANDAVEVLTCNVNPTGDDLVVTSFENQKGPDATLVGRSCLETLSTREASHGGLRFGTPTALPVGAESTDPGCMIWVIDGGTILETN